MAGKQNFVSLKLKAILLELESPFLLQNTVKTQCFVHLSFNLT